MCRAKLCRVKIGKEGILHQLNEPNYACHRKTSKEVENSNGVGHFGLGEVACSMKQERISILRFARHAPFSIV